MSRAPYAAIDDVMKVWNLTPRRVISVHLEEEEAAVFSHFIEDCKEKRE